jgi:hypothetical protein
LTVSGWNHTESCLICSPLANTSPGTEERPSQFWVVERPAIGAEGTPLAMTLPLSSTEKLLAVVVATRICHAVPS